MKRLFPILITLIITTASCKKSHLAYEQYIIGNWVEVKAKTKPDKNGIVLEQPKFQIPGFTFYTDHTFDNKLGYFKKSDSFIIISSSWRPNIFLGVRSKFKIEKDTLKLLNPVYDRWDSYYIVKLKSDSLQLDMNGRITTFKRYKTERHKTPQFDQIVLSTSGCFGTCPIINIVLNKNGGVIFNGVQFTNKQGLFKGNISTSQYQSLENNFTAGDFDSLEDSYKTDWTDDETITTTFIKDGKIIKTVKDYGRMAPYWFTWAYVPLRNLYQTINLTAVSDSLPFLNIKKLSFDSSFKTGDQVATLQQSESFSLFCSLQQGKLSDKKFKPRFKLHRYFQWHNLEDADTDGRFYTFNIKGKSVTIDIGFNFYDVNEKNWIWRKADKYD